MSAGEQTPEPTGTERDDEAALRQRLRALLEQFWQAPRGADEPPADPSA